MILFFDVFIISEENERTSYIKGDINRRNIFNYRENSYTYRYQSRLDITKYSLLSYSNVKWDKVIIRFDAEDKKDKINFKEFCHHLFPSAIIEDNRSDNVKIFTQTFERLLSEYKDTWVFFSTDNDHPILCDPEKIYKLIDYAESIEKKYNDVADTISILYSHYPESQYKIKLNNKYIFPYGYTHQFLEENNIATVSIPSILSIDSCRIFRLKFLREIFSKSQKTTKVVRTEDTEFYHTNKYREILLMPKFEICRHYDAYAFYKKVPPLFIPDGIFEKKIRINYSKVIKKGFVNINPTLNIKSVINLKIDLNNQIDEIPFFWRDRIQESNIDDKVININRVDEKIYLFRILYNLISTLDILFQFSKNNLLGIIFKLRRVLINKK